jgi:PleD family two-component response regulator
MNETLPITSNEPSAVTPAPAASAPPPLRVLVAEDHGPARAALSQLLQKQGFEVTAVADGMAARAILESYDSPAIAVLDWMLPGLTGLEVCQAVRASARGRYTYIIVITGRDSTQDVLDAFAAGVDDFVRKPADPPELLARIRGGQRIITLESSLAGRVRELEEALERVRQLKRLLPICMYCKRVRDDSAYWRQIDEYIHIHTGTDFSHGICPECMAGLNDRSAGLP